MAKGIIKSIEIIDDVEALKEFEENLQGKGFTIYQVGEDKVLYSIDEDGGEALNEALEENAFVLNLDYARAKLVFIDKDGKKIADSKTFIKEFATENDVEDSEEGIPISLLPELIDYINENPQSLKEDISEVFNATTGTSELDAKIIDKQQKTLETSDDEFIDDVEDEVEETEPETEIENDVTNTLEENTLEEFVDEEPKIETDKVEAPKKKEKKVKDIPDLNKVKDPLMEKAILLFDTQQYIKLPVFDELTHKELQEQLIESHFTVSQARDRGINKIYERLKNETAESAQMVKDQVLKKARKKHEETIKKIENNYKIYVDQLLNKHNAEYERTREEFVQSQIPLIRKDYDAKHAKNHQSVINVEIEKLQRNSAKIMSQERKRYQEHVDQVLSDSKNQVISSVRVDDVIEEYNKIAEEQKELLLLQAKNTKQEIGVTLSEIVKERDNLKDQINDYQSKIDEIKQSEQERIESSVTAAIQAKEQRILEDSKAELEKAMSKEKSLLSQIEQLEKDLASEKENKELMRREYIAPSEETVATSEDSEGSKRGHAEEGYLNAKSSRFSRFKFILASTLSLTFLLLFTFGVFVLSDIKSEMAKSNYIDQSSYLAQLEADGRYDKAATEMEKLGYGDDRISEMYLEHGAYLKALEADSAILPEVLKYADKKESEEKKQILENVKKGVNLDKKHKKGLDVRLAMADENTESVISLTEDVESVDADSIRAAASYLIDKKSFSPADRLVKSLKDDKLASDLSKARKADLTQKIDLTTTEVEALKKEQSEVVESGKKLEKELDKIKKKDKKARSKKQSAIKKNKAKQKELQESLSEKEKELEELEKQL